MTERSSVIEPLTGREADVLSCLAKGFSNSEIAAQLFLSPSTVKWYVRQLNSKLDTLNRDEIVVRARALGLLDTHLPADTASTYPHNLPYQTTPFIGRDAELDELGEILANPDVRLVTILAHGGMGKTRFALEAAEQQLYHFEDGVYFVPLQPLTDLEQIVPAVAQQLGLQFMQDARSLKQQLLDYLSNKQVLLVLDNWEHLLGGAPLISEMLQAAQGVKVLATSREKINLTGETVYGLRGMQFQTWENLDEALQLDAVKLLAQTARRVQAEFQVTVENLASVTQICQLTEGMPLGILLAIGWLDVLPLERIVDELRQNIDFLETEMRDMPERQRSIRAIFEATWERLEPPEQQVFMKLSVFKGGCTLEAAQFVTGAKLRTLQVLVNKALLLQTKTGRYDIHELLRQYSYERLAASGLVDEVLRQHSLYYAGFLHQREADLKGRRQLDANDEIETELDNIRQFWYQALRDEAITLIDQALFSLATYMDVRCREIEYRTLFTDAEATFRVHYADHPVYARLLVYCAVTGFVLNQRWEATGQMLKQALAIATTQDDRAVMAQASCELARWLPVTGSQDEAERLCEASIELYSQVGDEDELASALYVKGYLLGISGRVDQSLEITRQTLEIYRRSGNEIGIAASLTNIAAATFSRSKIEAEALVQEALALRRRQKIPAGIAFSLLVLANEYDRLPSQHVEEAMQIARKIGHSDLIGRAWLGRCKIALVHGRFDEAEHQLAEAYRLIETNEYGQWYILYKGLTRLGVGDLAGANRDLIEALKQNWYVEENQLLIIIGQGIIMANQGQTERGLSLLSFGLNHPQISKGFADSPLVSRQLRLIQTLLTEEAYDAAWEHGKSFTLKAIIAELCNEYGIDAPDSIKTDN